MTSARPLHRRFARGAIGLAAAIVLAATGVATSAAAVDTTASHQDRGCVRSLPQGTSTVTVAFEGDEYPVLVHVPAVSTRRALPLVLDLHGSNANASSQAAISGLHEIADRERFIVAEPQGAIEFPQTLPEGNWAWNVPGVPLTSGTYPPADARDDVAYLRTVVTALDAAGCVDDRRVYATGFSGGGRMASALACHAADVFAAIAPVAGLRAGHAAADDLSAPMDATCEPSRAVSVITFHGTDDFVNPYLGNADPRWGYTVQAAVDRWRELDSCAPRVTERAVSDAVTSFTWKKCARGADVVLYEIDGGGHTWPGTAVDLSPLGTVNMDISASAVMWDFFSHHKKR